MKSCRIGEFQGQQKIECFRGKDTKKKKNLSIELKTIIIHHVYDLFVLSVQYIGTISSAITTDKEDILQTLLPSIKIETSAKCV